MHHNGKMDKSKQPKGPLDLDEEELHGGIDEVDLEEVQPITWLLRYIPPRKSMTKVPKDLDNTKFMVSTPLLPKSVMVEGPLLAQIPNIKMEYKEFGDHNKFP